MRSVFILAALAPIVAAPETLKVEFDEGGSVTRTFTGSLDLELVGYSVEFNGEEREDVEVPEVTVKEESERVFTDEWVSVDKGRATELTRSFETLQDSSTDSQPGPEGESMKSVTEGQSELEGTVVRFLWDEGEEEWQASFVGDDDAPDEELLEGLRWDADYTFLLPPEDERDEVEVGDSWELEAEVFERIAEPSGDLHIDEEDEDHESNAEFEEQFSENLSGGLEATVKEIEDGLMTIAIGGDVETSISRELELPEGAPDEAEFLQELEFAFEAEGMLVWSLELGRAVSFELTCDASFVVTNNQIVGEDFQILITEEFEGTYAESASFE